MLDIRRMRVLREVAIRGSMSAAASALNFTPSAVSQQIATLEREAGVALVERGPRSVTLTDAGRALVEHAEVILRRLELAESEIRAIAGLSGGRLRVATFRTAGEALVPEALSRFHRLHPAVELRLTEGEPEDYLPVLRAGGFDIALSFEYDEVRPPHGDSVHYRLLMEEPMCVVLSEDHPAAQAPTLDLADLAEEQWVGSSSRSAVHDFTANVCRSIGGFEPHMSFETDDYHVAQALVANQVGVAFLPLMSVWTARPDVVIRRLDESPRRRIFVACRADGLRVPAVSEMFLILAEVCQIREQQLNELLAAGGPLRAVPQPDASPGK